MNDLPKKSQSRGLGGDQARSVGKNLGGGLTPRALNREDPENFGSADMYEESNANWQRTGLAMTADMAESWFGDTLFAGSIQEKLEDLGLASEFPGLSERFLQERFGAGVRSTLESFGELQELNESPTAQRVLEYLNLRGVSGESHGITQVAKGGFINANDLPGVPSAAVVDSLAGQFSHTWMGQWQTRFESRFLQNFRVFKNAAGNETITWFVDAVIGSRPPALTEGDKLDRHEVFRREILMPTLAKRIFYLSETPFPSSMATFDRSLAFPDVEDTKRPTPFCTVSDFRLTLCTVEQASGAPVANFHIFPQVVTFGWSFSATEPNDLEHILPSVVDSLTCLMSILEDGFRNHRGFESQFSWSDFFGALTPDDTEQIPAATCRWIPATQMGALLSLSNELYDRGYREDNESDLTWVAQNGAGEAVSNAINTLVYSHLLPRGNNDEARQYLEVAINLEHVDQSTNAITNLAQVYLAEGNDDLAESLLLSALDRTDEFSEGEASFLLGELFAGRNKITKARHYYERALRSQQEPFASNARSRLADGDQSLEQDESLAATKSRRFCTNCGAKFSTGEEKFCGSCGAPS